MQGKIICLNCLVLVGLTLNLPDLRTIWNVNSLFYSECFFLALFRHLVEHLDLIEENSEIANLKKLPESSVSSATQEPPNSTKIKPAISAGGPKTAMKTKLLRTKEEPPKPKEVTPASSAGRPKTAVITVKESNVTDSVNRTECDEYILAKVNSVIPPFSPVKENHRDRNLCSEPQHDSLHASKAIGSFLNWD